MTNAALIIAIVAALRALTPDAVQIINAIRGKSASKTP